MDTLKIKSIKKIESKKRVYDLSVENNNNFFIGSKGNILTHNCDYLTLPAQASLRNVIEKFSSSVRFILTCNYIERIIDPLKSRCHALKIEPASKSDVAFHLDKILQTEKIYYTQEDLKLIINSFFPDVRRMLNEIQLNTEDKVLNVVKEILINSSYFNDILDELIKKNPNWKSIRQIVLDSNVKDFDQLYKFLYEHASEFIPGKEGTVAILTNEHLYQAQFRIDKEINFMSFIAKLIKEK